MYVRVNEDEYEHMYTYIYIYIYIYTHIHVYICTESMYVYLYMGRCLKERLQKENRGGHTVLESIIFSLRYKAGPQGVLVNPRGGVRLAIDRR